MLVTCFSLSGVDVWIAGCCVAAPAEYATPPTTDVIASAATLVRTMRRDGRRQERNAMVTSSENGECLRKQTNPAAGRSVAWQREVQGNPAFPGPASGIGGTGPAGVRVRSAPDSRRGRRR